MKLKPLAVGGLALLAPLLAHSEDDPKFKMDSYDPPFEVGAEFQNGVVSDWKPMGVLKLKTIGIEELGAPGERERYFEIETTIGIQKGEGGTSLPYYEVKLTPYEKTVDWVSFHFLQSHLLHDDTTGTDLELSVYAFGLDWELQRDSETVDFGPSIDINLGGYKHVKINERIFRQAVSADLINVADAAFELFGKYSLGKNVRLRTVFARIHGEVATWNSQSENYLGKYSFDLSSQIAVSFNEALTVRAEGGYHSFNLEKNIDGTSIDREKNGWFFQTGIQYEFGN